MNRMRRKTCVAALLGWFAAAIGSATAELPAQEPSVAELARALESDNRDIRRDAARELATRGREAKAALPQLIRGLQDRDPQVWHFSILAIDRLGPDAADAVDVLVRQIQAYPLQRRYRAAVALGHIGKASLDPLREVLRNGKGNARASAAQALAVMGPQAAPAVDELARLLGDKDVSVRSAAAEALGHIGGPAVEVLERQLTSSDPKVQAAAASGVGFLEDVGASLRSRLAALVRSSDPQVRVAALEALGRTGDLGGDRARLFVEALVDSEESVRRAAMNAMAAIDDGSALIPPLLELLGKEKDETKLADVVFLLGRHGRGREDVVTALLDLAKRHPEMRRGVKRSLVRMGRPAVRPLMKLLVSDAVFADLVAEALAEIGGGAKAALLEALDAEDPAVRASAVTAIGRLPTDGDTRRALLERLGDPAPQVRAVVVRAVGLGVGSSINDWRILFESRMSDPEPAVRAALAELVAKLPPDQDQVAAWTARLLKDREGRVRQVALTGLSSWDSLPSALVEEIQQVAEKPDAESRPVLLRLAARHSSLRSRSEATWRTLARAAVKAPSVEARRAAAQFWGKLASHDPEAQREVARLVADGESSVATAALEALPKLESESEPLWNAVAKLARKSSGEVRVAAVQAVLRVHKPAAEKVKLLQEVLRDKDWSVRAEACHALGAMGAAAKGAVPQLLELLRSRDDEDAARRALQQIGTAGPDAVPALRQLLRSRRPRQRAYAVYLLGRVEPAPVALLDDLKKLRGQGDERFQRLLESTIRRIERESKKPSR